jgi:malate dehydrogenase
MSKKVAIIGAAGTLGSCAAFMIAKEGLADEMVLLPGTRENLVRFHQMDLETAITGINDMSIRFGHKEDLAGADVVILAAGAPWRRINSRMELLDDSMPIIEEAAQTIRQYCPEAVVITLTNPVDPLNWALWRLTGLPRERFLGYSLNDTFRFRRLLAQALAVPSPTVDATVVGEHGPHQVLLFSSVRVNGKRIDIDRQTRAGILSEIPNILNKMETLGAGRTTGWTSSIGISAIVRAVLEDTGEVIPCSAVLDGEYGRKDLSASLPVRLGRGGVQGFSPFEMEPDERQELEKCFDFLETTARSLEHRLVPVARHGG